MCGVQFFDHDENPGADVGVDFAFDVGVGVGDVVTTVHLALQPRLKTLASPRKHTAVPAGRARHLPTSPGAITSPPPRPGAELAAAFGDQEKAADIHRCLLPYADLFVPRGAGQSVVEGSARRYLGIAATVLGHLDEAVRHLSAAISATSAEACRSYRGIAAQVLDEPVEQRGKVPRIPRWQDLVSGSATVDLPRCC